VEIELNEQLKFLISLQEIDTAISSIEEKIKNLPLRLEKVKSRLKETSASFEKIKAEYNKTEKKKKDKYDELENIQEKIAKLKAKSTEIKTNKEYEAYLKEVKTLEDNKYQIEEEILSIMEVVETLAKGIKKEEAKVREAQEALAQEEKAIDDEKNKLFSEMEIYKIKRADIVSKMDLEIYERYKSIAENYNGIAVVETKDEVCLGCNTNIPPQLYNDVKDNHNIYTCYHCNRFLYYKEK